MRVFLGYDEREAIAYHVLANSILTRASEPVSVTPLYLSNLRKVYTRPYKNQSTMFSFSRFLVPYLCNYQGWALYMDCDMLMRADLAELLSNIPMEAFSKDVLCVQHDYTPKSNVKFNGNMQVSYPRKNWSSLMLFNNTRCTALTPEYVNNADPGDLHQMKWAREIGALPLEWNWLVGEYPFNPLAKCVHFTNGTPCFPEYAACDYADEWFNERRITLAGG